MVYSLLTVPGIGQPWEVIHWFEIFFRRVAASSNNGIKGDGKKPPSVMKTRSQ